MLSVVAATVEKALVIAANVEKAPVVVGTVVKPLVVVGCRSVVKLSVVVGGPVVGEQRRCL